MPPVLEIDPPAFLTIGGDQLIYCLGRIAWYIWVGPQLCWVTNATVYNHLPDPDTLEMLRKEARQRLGVWLERPVLRPFSERLIEHIEKAFKPSAPRPQGTDYEHLADMIDAQAEAIAERDDRVRAWSKRRTREHLQLIDGLAYTVEQRWKAYRYGIRYLIDQIDDHTYIEAMFRLYSQQRYRLL